MKSLLITKFGVFFVALFLLVIPTVIQAQPEQTQTEPPPIEQPLLREGSLAVQLESALGLGNSNDEVMAESRLGEVGITPRNGWIADYPVTPDIIGELQKSIGDAADSKKITLNREEAMKKLDDIISGLGGVSVKPYTNTKTYETLPGEAQDYPNPTVINNYYYDEGPPIVTYYTPPPDFYYLYSWVPYPFWCYGFWFSGFFILNDFHRHIFAGHKSVFVSNHFNDFKQHRVFRVDPVSRFNGRTFAGIGVTKRHGFISTGVPRSNRTIFNAPRVQAVPGMRPIPGLRTATPTPRSIGGASIPPSRSFTRPYHGGGKFTAPSHGSVTSRPSVHGGRTFAVPSRGGRTGTAPSHGGRTFSPSTQGGGSFRGGVRGK